MFMTEAIIVGAVLLTVILLFVIVGRKAPKIEEKPNANDKQEVSVAVPIQDESQNVFRNGLQKSRSLLSGSFSKIFSSGVNPEHLEELEESLLIADVGPSTAQELIQFLQKQSKSTTSPEELRDQLKSELLRRLLPKQSIATVEEGPLVILVVGVNGSGKTTTIGKLAKRYKGEGKKVLLAAGDTFRAGAIEQLQVWADRAAVDIIMPKPKADPASVVYQALDKAKSQGFDVVICDTAGRLQAQAALMEELAKISRTAGKLVPNAPHETLLVLDSTIGQNALMQAEGFKKVTPVSGVALTKLDGTAKGGIVIAVRDKIGIPVKLVGLGEGIDDLYPFEPESFVEALLEVE